MRRQRGRHHLWRVPVLLWIGLSLLIAVGLVLLVFELHRRTRTDEEKIRDTVEAFLDACMDGDLGEVWDLQAQEVRDDAPMWRRQAEIWGVDLPAHSNDEKLFVAHAAAIREGVAGALPERVEDWFPFALPSTALRSLRVRTVEIDASPDNLRATVVLRPPNAAGADRRRWFAEISLVKEGNVWGIDTMDFHVVENLPEQAPLLAEQVRSQDDGRTSITLSVVPGADRSSLTPSIRTNRRPRHECLSLTPGQPPIR